MNSTSWATIVNILTIVVLRLALPNNVTTMTIQCSDPLFLSRPEWTACCHGDLLQARVTFSKIVAADIVANDEHFNHFLTADKPTPHRKYCT